MKIFDFFKRVGTLSCFNRGTYFDVHYSKGEAQQSNYQLNDLGLQFSEVESKYPKGEVFSYLNQDVTIIDYHRLSYRYDCGICGSSYEPYPVSSFTSIPGVYMQWFDKGQKLRSTFLPYDQLKLLKKCGG